MPGIEWNLNLGTIVTFVFLAGGFFLVTRSDLRSIKEELKLLRGVITSVAEQNVRLDNQGKLLASQGELIATLEDRVYRLSQGHGFIQRDIDGEYPPRHR